jgi:hypothetical protein
VAVQVLVAPGASAPPGQVTVPTFGSVTLTADNVTLPVFVIRNVYPIVDPTVFPDGVPACLSKAIVLVRVIGVVVESVAWGVAPFGAVPWAVAVLLTCPRFTSAWVSVYVAVHVRDAPGASAPPGQVTVPTFGSVTLTADNVTLPVFVTRNVYPIVDPTVFPDGVPACLSNVIVLVRVIGVDVLSVAVTAAPVGGVPDAVAVLSTTPAFTSAWVNVYVAVHVRDAPGASAPPGQLTAPTFASVTLTGFSVTLPVFVIRNEYPIVDPTVFPDGVPACLSSTIAGPAVIGVSVESVAVGAATPTGGVPVAVAVFAT